MNGGTLRVRLVPPSGSAVDATEVADLLRMFVVTSQNDLALGVDVQIAVEAVERPIGVRTWIARLHGHSVHVPDVFLRDDPWLTAVSLSHALHQCREGWVTPEVVTDVSETSGLADQDAEALAKQLVANGVSLRRLRHSLDARDTMVAGEQISASAAPALELAISSGLKFDPEYVGRDGLPDPQAMWPDLADTIWDAVGILLPRIRVAVDEELSNPLVRLSINDVALAPEKVSTELLVHQLGTYVERMVLAHAPSLVTLDTTAFLLARLGEAFPISAQAVRTVSLHRLTAGLRVLVRDGGNLGDLLGIVESVAERIDETGPDATLPEELVAAARRRLGCGISGRVVPWVLHAIRLVGDFSSVDERKAGELITRVANLKMIYFGDPAVPVALVSDGPYSPDVSSMLRPPFPESLVRRADELPVTVRLRELGSFAV